MCLHPGAIQGILGRVGHPGGHRWMMIQRFGLFLLTLPLAAAIPALPALAQYYPPPPPPYYRSAPPPGVYQARLPRPEYEADDKVVAVLPPRRRGPQASQLPPVVQQ